jgi:tetratricopeptide (TPR) repeat protein
MATSRDPLGRARALYQGRVNPRRTQQMRGAIHESIDETAALFATTLLCDYLNQWNAAGPAEKATAEAAVALALATDPTLYLAHYAEGFLRRAEGRHDASLAAFDRTIRYNAEFARAHAQRGETLVYLGRPSEAIGSVEKALEISPASSVRGYFYWVMGRARFSMKQYTEAIPWLQRSVRNWPDAWYNRAYLISSHALSGKLAAARRVLRAFDREFPGYTLAQIMRNESVAPDDNPQVIDERERFHEGLFRAGMLNGLEGDPGRRV